MKDTLGIEHKTYKDYVTQARCRGETDPAYDKVLNPKKYDWKEWFENGLHRKEEC